MTPGRAFVSRPVRRRGEPVMVLAMLLALRLAWMDRALGGMDKVYRLHKWAGIGAIVSGCGCEEVQCVAAGTGVRWVRGPRYPGVVKRCCRPRSAAAWR